ncbi:MAG TPA: DUF411 domain-containing protein [Burkholderiales bacterium]
MTLGVLPAAFAQYALPKVVVYKSPACGCCGEWEKHMRAAGFRLETRNLSDVAAMKSRLGVPEALRSCHTATFGDYVLEGHVPAGDVKRLLRERTKARGLAVPGMPAGAPGMEQGRAQPYATIAFDETGSRVFERH